MSSHTKHYPNAQSHKPKHSNRLSAPFNLSHQSVLVRNPGLALGPALEHVADVLAIRNDKTGVHNLILADGRVCHLR